MSSGTDNTIPDNVVQLKTAVSTDTTGPAPLVETQFEAEAQALSAEEAAALDKVRSTLKTYEFLRSPGVIIQRVKGQVQALIAQKIEKDLESRFNHLTLTELDQLMFAIMQVSSEIAEENMRKAEEQRAAEDAALEAAKAAIKEKKETNRAEKRATKKKGK